MVSPSDIIVCERVRSGPVWSTITWCPSKIDSSSSLHRTVTRNCNATPINIPLELGWNWPTTRDLEEGWNHRPRTASKLGLFEASKQFIRGANYTIDCCRNDSCFNVKRRHTRCDILDPLDRHVASEWGCSRLTSERGCSHLSSSVNLIIQATRRRSTVCIHTTGGGCF